MCGIAGIFLKSEAAASKLKSFVSSSKLMNHRGPDNCGIYSTDRLAFIHYRLAIIDLDARSNQPFSSFDSRYVSVYNGEIYNFADIREKYGIVTKTSSDTEVMLESFVKEGVSVASEWNGIFACAIYDVKENVVLLFRDRLGVKPLYYYEDDECFMFASEAKAILDFLPNFEFEYSGLAQYIWLGNTSGAHTVIKGLRKVEPGTVMTISLDDFKIKHTRFWNIENHISIVPRTEDEALMETRRLVRQAVKRQVVSDVPLGVLLSGGIDSSAVVAMASECVPGKLDSYTAFYDYDTSDKTDLLRARKVAKLFGTNHHEIEVKGGDIVSLFKKMVIQYDEPFGDAAGLPLYQITKQCSRDKRVILQGDGGDELFAGYRRYSVLSKLNFWRVVTTVGSLVAPSPDIRQRMSRIKSCLNRPSFAEVMAYYSSLEPAQSTPFKVLSTMIQEKLQVVDWKQDFYHWNNLFRGKSSVDKMLLTDLKVVLANTYLEKVDKATMACSVEARVPMLDNDLVDFSLSLDVKYKVRGKTRKYILKKAMEGIIPDDILYGPKRGFDAPYHQWLRRDLYDFAVDVFSSVDSKLINREVCLNMLKEHKSSPKNDLGPILWKCLVLSYWLIFYKHKIIA